MLKDKESLLIRTQEPNKRHRNYTLKFMDVYCQANNTSNWASRPVEKYGYNTLSEITL